MPEDTLQSDFNSWLDSALSQRVPDATVAFCFNLTEPWCIEIIGSGRYSDEDSDWACEESFRPEVKGLPLPAAAVGSTWEVVLEAAKKLVSTYLEQPSSGSNLLRKSNAVAVGFVDGDLHKVWPR